MGLFKKAGNVTGEEILATGTPCRATLLSVTPLNLQKEGVGEVYGIVMSVVVGTDAPFQAQVGIGVPAACVPLLVEGANLPAKTRTDVQDATTIVWDDALAEAGATSP